MSKEYIERETILKTPPFTKCVGDLSEYAEGYLDCVEDACEAIKKAPAADVKPVVHGMWRVIHQTINPFGVELECSNCEQRTIFGNASAKFCPNCGADMRGERQ